MSGLAEKRSPDDDSDYQKQLDVLICRNRSGPGIIYQ
jgi:hypothetical protein